ncbi:hypothetical protein DFQ27_002339 [Actinomortierella ambigua]|uniref:WIBG Mago-binding domain-containing protein n=1 Tax=Actinomortierella ambigua TaxID=1343610 RepID=A0A9P6QC63_9FUNG|nr:hypothetical protein DFQ27_002339 [Actinomortierella ambigua]
MASTPSLSGIVTTNASSTTDDDGERVIPASRRPDGTFRKERRVRANYVPPEDVSRYTNARLASGRPTPAQLQQQKEKEQAERLANMSRAQKKNEKRKVKRKEDQQGQPHDQQQQGEQHQKAAKVDDKEEKTVAAEAASDQRQQQQGPPQPSQDPAKQLRALNKKLAQAKTLKERQDKGETLLPEQADKVAKMDDLEAQIAALQLS